MSEVFGFASIVVPRQENYPRPLRVLAAVENGKFELSFSAGHHTFTPPAWPEGFRMRRRQHGIIEVHTSGPSLSQARYMAVEKLLCSVEPGVFTWMQPEEGIDVRFLIPSDKPRNLELQRYGREPVCYNAVSTEHVALAALNATIRVSQPVAPATPIS